MSAYLGCLENVDDLPVKAEPPDGYLGPNPVLCPKCKGHGGWNLELNAYGPGKHFQASCNQCVGWGWVRRDSPDAKCVHEWGDRVNVSTCLNNYMCKKCGYTKTVDSSG